MEYRRLPRPKLNTTLKVMDEGKTYQGRTLDISLSGMMCEVPVEYLETRPILVSFKMSARDKRITTWATPVWSHQEKSGVFKVGIQFLQLDSAHYAQVADYVAAHWMEQQSV